MPMNPLLYKVSFRITHPNIDPDIISMKLSLTPNTSWKAGARRKSPKHVALEGSYPNTYWSCRLAQQPGVSLADFLERFTQSLIPHRDFLLELRSAGGTQEYFIGWFVGTNSGELFSHRLLGSLADLQIDLSMDVYGVTQMSMPHLTLQMKKSFREDFVIVFPYQFGFDPLGFRWDIERY